MYGYIYMIVNKVNGKKLPSHPVSDDTRRKIGEANRGKKRVIIDGKIRYIRLEENK